MLTITIPGGEFYDERKQEFLELKPATIQMEHSLVSVSKWESKWGKPFLSKDPKHQKTEEEILDYLCCMSLNKNITPDPFLRITKKQMDEINAYIEAPMTATWFREDPNHSRNREVITSELIYYWMIAMNIPFECQKWHLNRLLTLIRVCSIKNAPSKKMSQREMLAQRRALNESRRQSLNTRG